ncbi:MAG TPA: ribosome biogenesis GTP-binding protein YihA/YsxC, partial [Chitinophagaceae bacterium]|nr:ribosome biogenesis GTP-binding protein YihA/YsxC [Chitinophagaceae bacterium]
EYAFIGRSNVGKSSLINMLTSRKKLAHVSNSPGKTQTINYFRINKKWNLVDLPGYGFAKVSQKQRAKWKKMIANYIKNRENLITLFVLIDSRHKPQKSDLDFIEQLGEWDIPFAIVFTKTDKSKQRFIQKNVKSFFEEMKKRWEFLPIYFMTSAVKGRGKEEILDYIEEYNIRFGAIA